MKKNSKDLLNQIDEIFSSEPDSSQKAWSLVHDFYQSVLTYMTDNGIKRAALAKKMGKSRAAISQMFNKNPNISVLKMVEIADAVGIDLVITTREQIQKMNQTKIVVIYKPVVVPIDQYFSGTAINNSQSFPLIVKEPQVSYQISSGGLI
ncbi:MAG TPA: hypothetical protein DHW42_00065 [Candidatus Marinimicrobia bacterium]|nr:hypothetical protein [Candidatus Neomarinimicrobiota bacterium]